MKNLSGIITGLLFTLLFGMMIGNAAGVNPYLSAGVLASAAVVIQARPIAGVLNSLLGPVTLGVGVSTTINLTYLPQYIAWTIGTTPTSIRINVLGRGTVMDLDAAGIDQLNGFDTNGLATNQFIFPLADGIIKNTNVEITIVNADAAGFNLYGWEKNDGLNFFVYQRQTILANSGVLFDKFALLAITAPGATDSFRTTYQSGVVSEMSLNEVKYDVSYFQNNVGSIYVINNLDQIVKSVNIIPAANRTAYLMKYEPAMGEIDNAPISRT